MQNQMSSFEFISILISIIIGLGVTNLLAGTGRAFYRRKQNPIDEIHIVFTAATLLVLVLNWWVMFSWNREVNWSFDEFLVLIVSTISLYMLTIFLYPPDLSEAEEHRDRFQRNRTGYYSTFIAVCLLDVARTGIRGDLFHPVWYVPFVGQYAVLAGSGLVVAPRLRPLLRVVSTNYCVGLVARGKKIPGGQRGDRLEIVTNPAYFARVVAAHPGP